MSDTPQHSFGAEPQPEPRSDLKGGFNPLLGPARPKLSLEMQILQHLGQRLAHLTGASRPPEWPSNPAHMMRMLESLIEQCERQQSRQRESSQLGRQLQEERLQVERLKTEFLKNVSHELRTPLASIEGFAAALLRGMEKKSPEGSEEMTPETRRRFLHIISQEARRLGDLIENMLEMAQIEARPHASNQRLFRAREVFLEAIATFRSKWTPGRAAPVRMALNPDASGPSIYADQDAVREILRHLLDNAHNFSGGQEITLGAEPLEDQGSSPFARFTRLWVQDRGIGIPKADHSRLFSKFNRLETAAHTLPGTGLGLSIVWALVKQNGGSVTLDSDVGKGATFSILLPSEPPAEE